MTAIRSEGLASSIAGITPRLEPRPFDPAATWHELTSGKKRLVASYCSERDCHLELEPSPSGGGRPVQQDVATLERILLGDCQKVIAFDVARSASTIAVRAARALRAIGLTCKSSALPSALVILVQSAHGCVPSPDPRRSTLSGGAPRELLTLRRPDVRRHGALSPAERALVEYLIEGRTRREMADLRDSSDRTIANQLGNIYRKLGVSGRIPLIRAVIQRNGYLSPALGQLSVCARSTEKERHG